MGSRAVLIRIRGGQISVVLPFANIACVENIHIKFLHDPDNHTQALHEPIDGNAQHPVGSSFVFGPQYCLIGSIGWCNGRERAQDEWRQFFVYLQGLKRS